MSEGPEPLKLVRKYGNYSLCYSSLDPRLERFFVPGVEGFIAYKPSGRTLVGLAEPVCAPLDLPVFINAFKEQGAKKGMRVVFFGASGQAISSMRNAGFECTPAGRDSRINIQAFSLAGKRMANVRGGYNRASNGDLRAWEYQPEKGRDKVVQAQCSRISDEWLSSKGGVELEFVIGRLDWERPGDRRFFVASDNGGVQGFLVLHPIPASNGWYMDMSRRGLGSPYGTMDYLLVNAIEALKKEGSMRLYLGMLPNLAFPTKVCNIDPIHRKILLFVSSNFDRFYPYSSEKFFKSKYCPTWEDLYFCSEGRLDAPLARDMFRVFMNTGLLAMLKREFQNFIG